MKSALRYLFVVAGAICSILLFLLASASDNSGFFDRYYGWLLGLNASVAVALVLLVGVSLFRLYSRYKSGKFGSRLMTRLVVLFAAIGVLPGLVIFLVSVQFVSHSIDSWFNVRVEEALDAGLDLGRTALDESLAELEAQARGTVRQLAEDPFYSAPATLARFVRRHPGTQSAIIVDADGGLIVSAMGERRINLSADLPSAVMLNKAKDEPSYAAYEGGGELRDDRIGAPQPAPLDANSVLRLRVLMAIPDPVQPSGAHLAPRYLQIIQAVPQKLASNGEMLRTAFSEYKERFVARQGLRKMYTETLTLTLLLAVFGAIAAAFLIANDLAQPLLLLAEGTRAVAEGDLSPRPIVASSDELGTLTQSFNTMTRQLSEARSAVERNRIALQNAKAHLESVLANMSAGVMVLDSEFRLVTCNDSVERILQHAGVTLIGQPLSEVEGMQEFAAAIISAFSAQSAQTAAGRNVARLHWQRQIEIPRQPGSPEDHEQILLTRGSRLPLETGTGYIVVFDDITDVISAQRSIAWGEVARRLAHEIKNPLTPIQLSAERLQMKLESKLAGPDVELLNKASTTIVNQVSAMKRMVDDFRDYARTPPAVLQPLDLNTLVEDILHLYVSGEGDDIIHANLAPALPMILGDDTQLRQVIHNLLQNAQDALQEHPPADAEPRIDVVTEGIIYQSADGGTRIAVRLSISDNGPGFAPRILANAFEPYVTSKAKGTGLGLAMVKKIIEEHGGRIDIQNRDDSSGASVLILLLKLASV
ncbi:Signal transduction histidine kinase involved in nitrogen fixation and metabolism regulation [Duganella sp. CF458]|uniref:sensor histidine kinase n=1 Tax=Duganella sp. CF458 TaxID=1884368 RepID=UPI0008DF38D8|nr:ATP-binding protein [Duganella sp. CF458]SFG85205.1 Signal transduction histidine kinase involved in nitrogen fixation and metabolism regulation [Duganella sp. CF458]